MKSIFELEKRTDLKKETLRIERLLNSKSFYRLYPSYYKSNFEDICNDCFKAWPDRYTATTLTDYFDLIKLPNYVGSMNEEQYYYYLQFIYNFINWINSHLNRISNPSTLEYYIAKLAKDNSLIFSTILENIDLIAELTNFKIEKTDKYYTFVKRDADVDSILSIIENEDDLRLALLEYNDFRIENNIAQKRIILKKIGDYLEPLRKEFSSYNKSLNDDIFFMLNKFYIRHNNDGNIKFETESEYIKWYDYLFKMMIQLIRTKFVLVKQNELKHYKSNK